LDSSNDSLLEELHASASMYSVTR